VLESSNQLLPINAWFDKATERVPRLYEEKLPEEIKRQGRPQQPATYDFARRKALVMPIRHN